MPSPPRARGPRALVSSGVACLVALVVAGCTTTGSSSSSNSGATIKGSTLAIYISEPADIRSNAVAQDIVHAEQMAFSAHSKEVSDYKLDLQQVQYGEASNNARAAIEDADTIAYMGEVEPGASDQTAGITNALDVLQVSPTDNALELTQSTPAIPGGPKNFYEQWSTYGQTFARLVPSASEEAAVQVAEMKALGVSRLYVSNDGSDYGRALGDAVRSDAEAKGITLEPAVDEEVNGYFYGAESPSAAAKFFNHIAGMTNAKLFGPSSLNNTAFTAALSASVHNLYVSIPGFLSKDLPTQGRRFDTAFQSRWGRPPNVEAIFGYEAMSSLLRVLQKLGESADNRGDVVKGFLAQRRVPSVLGNYSINNAGNTSLDAFVFAHMRGGKLVPFIAAP